MHFTRGTIIWSGLSNIVPTSWPLAHAFLRGVSGRRAIVSVCAPHSVLGPRRASTDLRVLRRPTGTSWSLYLFPDVVTIVPLGRMVLIATEIRACERLAMFAGSHGHRPTGWRPTRVTREAPVPVD